MRFIILHLTDIHIKEGHNWIDDKIENISSSINQDIANSLYVFIAFSGDIAYSGKENEYKIAHGLIQKLKIAFEAINPSIVVQVVASPGNHDCDFDRDNNLRQRLISNMSYTLMQNDDQSISDACLIVQDSFWNFYKNYNPIPPNKLYYEVNRSFQSFIVSFKIINSAWMSQMNEKAGSLFFPIKHFEIPKTADSTNINISLFHHPISWFNPSTNENNRNELKNYLDNTSDIVLYGHEHISEHTKSLNIHTDQESLFLSGEALQPEHGDKTGFQTISIDIETRNAEIYCYSWVKDHFKRELIKSIEISQSSKGRLPIKEKYISQLERIVLPLKFKKEEGVYLSDIFVFPDLELMGQDLSDDYDYLDSEVILSNDEDTFILIEGANQSGKSSLLKMLYKQASNKGLHPLFISANNIKKSDIDSSLKKAFLEQYDAGSDDFDVFSQLKSSQRVFLIDDLHKSNYNSTTVINIINELKSRSTKLIITVNSTYSVLSKVESAIEDMQIFTLKPLGYEKRDALISNYHRINSDQSIDEYDSIFIKTKESFDKVETVLGNKLMPSYPIFVISILQTLEFAKPIDLRQTSYGYCYQSLIYIALSSRAKIENDKVDSFINILTELAYNLFEKDAKEISEAEFTTFHSLYSNKYLAPDLHHLKSKLLLSNIIEENEGFLRFNYDYIYYFLVARKISEIISTKPGKEIVTKLYSRVYIEENANILVFLTHHSRDEYFLELATFSSMTPFEDQAPITLDKQGEYYKLISQISESISTDVIIANKKPEEERIKYLKERDKKEQQASLVEEDSEQSIAEELLPFYQAFRSMEIVGQIIKNRKGSIEIPKLIEMITELYLTGFRTVSFFGKFIMEAKEVFVDSILDSVEETETDREIKERVDDFFQLISLHTLLNIFSKILHSVGVKELREQFDRVAENIGSPAARLVTFSLKSYYDRMSIRELQGLAKEFKDNPVAIFILRARVRSYLYQNYVDFKSKSKIANALNMKIQPSTPSMKRLRK